MLEVDLANEPDEDLLVYIGLRGEEGRSAWGEFYARHVKFIYDSLRRWGSVLDEADLEDVVQETFLRAYKRSHTYDPDKSNQDHRDIDVRGRRAVRAWLGSIAKNALRDELSDRGKWAPETLSDEVGEGPDGGEPSPPPGPKQKAVAKALSELHDREQDVIRTTMLFNKPGEEHQRLSDEASQALAKRWNTTPTNVRAVRSRAMRKLRDRVNELLREENP